MKRFIKYLGLGLLIVSCYNISKPKKPKDLISQDKMVNIVIDMTLLNSAKGINKTIIESHGIILENYIYKKYDIDSVQFALSNNYYAHHTDKYESIYSKVKDSLNALQIKFRLIKEQEAKDKRIKDSIQRTIHKDSLKKYKIKRELSKTTST